jgi:hypothetical protein
MNVAPNTRTGNNDSAGRQADAGAHLRCAG